MGYTDVYYVSFCMFEVFIIKKKDLTMNEKDVLYIKNNEYF